MNIVRIQEAADMHNETGFLKSGRPGLEFHVCGLLKGMTSGTEPQFPGLWRGNKVGTYFIGFYFWEWIDDLCKVFRTVLGE